MFKMEDANKKNDIDENLNDHSMIMPAEKLENRTIENIMEDNYLR